MAPAQSSPDTFNDMCVEDDSAVVHVALARRIAVFVDRADKEAVEITLWE